MDSAEIMEQAGQAIGEVVVMGIGAVGPKAISCLILQKLTDTRSMLSRSIQMCVPMTPEHGALSLPMMVALGTHSGR